MIELIFVLVSLYVIGAALIAASFRSQNRLRAVQNTPRSKSASAPQGLVELEGFAWPNGQCFTHYSGHQLIRYSFILQREEVRGSGKNRRREWITVFARYIGGPFFIVDATGLAEVNPQPNELSISKALTRSWRSIPENEKSFLREKVINSKISNFPPHSGLLGFFFSQKYRVVETELRCGSPAYAKGDFKSGDEHPKAISSPGLTDFKSKVFDLKNRANRNLRHILDKNQDGRISAEEAHQGYSFAAMLSQKKSAMQAAPEEQFMIYGHLSSSPNTAMLVADTHEEHLQKRLQGGKWIPLFSGAAVLALAIFATIMLFTGQIEMQPSSARNPAQQQNQ